MHGPFWFVGKSSNDTYIVHIILTQYIPTKTSAQTILISMRRGLFLVQVVFLAPAAANNIFVVIIPWLVSLLLAAASSPESS